MKKLISTLFLFLSLPAFADTCPCLDGDYRWQEPLDETVFIDLTVQQSGCATLEEIYDHGWDFKVKHKHTLDGKKYLVEDNGDFQAFETAILDSTGLHIREERHSVDEDTGENVLRYVQIEVTQSEPDMLVVKRTFFREDMAPIRSDKKAFQRK